MHVDKIKDLFVVNETVSLMSFVPFGTHESKAFSRVGCVSNLFLVRLDEIK